MKNRVKWMAFIVVALVSTSAWAVWDPDTDSNLEFNLDFESTPSAITTVDSVAALTGTLVDYNTTGQSVWRATDAIRGSKCADFNNFYDARDGAGDLNDCHISLPPNGPLFEFGDGWPGTDKTTFAFWFNMPNIQSGTFIRHIGIYDPEPENLTYYWEIRVYNSKLSFRHGLNCLRFETADSLSALGVSNNTWHHAVVVIDRENCRETAVPTKSLSSKMYIDGAEVPVVVTAVNATNMNLDSYPWYDSPLRVGAGDRDFDGLLDEVRIYSRDLSPLDVSFLYQNNPDAVHTTAILPIPGSSNVAIAADVNWVPSTGVSAQYVYFGTDPNMLNLPLVKTILHDGDVNEVNNTDLGGPFPLDVTYYWYVKSTIGGVDSNSPLWSFTTETGKAYDPVPADNQEDVDVSDVNIYWSASVSAESFDVYLSNNLAKVEAMDACQIADDITITQIDDINAPLRSETYYWRVVSNFPTGSVAGDIWSFTTRPYELVFNTRKNHTTTYQDYAIPALTCSLHSDGWTDVVTGTLDTDANIVVFNFPSGFDYDKRYDITVVPAYRGQDVNSTTNIRGISLNVTGDFYFDGKIRLAGEDLLVISNDTPLARSGGFVGPRHNSGTTGSLPDSGSWTAINISAPYYNRYNNTTGSTTSKDVFVPTAKGRSLFGPGIGVNPPYKGGGGGGYGGNGGDSGRGYFFGVFSGGYSYGSKDVPVPFGGSGGGWGGQAAGTSGAGGIEIIATGNVVLDSNSEIRANGGDALYSPTDYPGGGGAGGSVKIIAGGSFTNKGTINVNGGQGGNTSKQANECGGGGAGGRVAVFYGTTADVSEGVITARGGSKGFYGIGGASIAEDGQNGTIFITKSSDISPKRASAPTPKNGDKKVYCATDPCTIQLKWYSGYGAANDRVWFGTSSTSLAPLGTAATAATRGQHSISKSVNKDQTYYWQVKSDSNSIPSEIWSFQTVGWQCPVAVNPGSHGTTLVYVAGPTWDTNGDCVLNAEDFWYFAKDWRITRESGTQDYTLDNPELQIFASEWMLCIHRTDGCIGW
ncbi:MAG: LamG domain-containing protein [Phycisphaerae bacterium]